MNEIRQIAEISLILCLAFASFSYGIERLSQPTRKFWISFKRAVKSIFKRK